MTTDNWIALAALIVPTFGALCTATYYLIKLLIKSAMDDAKIARLEGKVERLQAQIKEMN
jgi:hypothetical protein